LQNGLAFFRRVDWGHRLPQLGLLLTDETFVAASLGGAVDPRGYLKLVWLPYVTWVGGSLVGVLAGSLLPALLRHAFGIAIDALFVSLLVHAVRSDGKTVWAAGAGAAGAYLGAPLGGWSLVVGMACGALVYLLASMRPARSA
jgi:predicted branched-subunit amino acid permease